jgi:hypothetical protein
MYHKIDLVVKIWRRREKETNGEGDDPDPSNYLNWTL